MFVRRLHPLNAPSPIVTTLLNDKFVRLTNDVETKILKRYLEEWDFDLCLKKIDGNILEMLKEKIDMMAGDV